MKIFSFSFALAGFATLAFLSGCGSKSSSPSGADMQSYQSPDDAQLAFNNWSVRCGGGECPPQVGQFVAVNGSNVGMCTATLIANDMAIMNSHCMDFGGLSPDDICKNAAIVFANDVDGSHVARCASIVTKSDISLQNFTQPDYLIFKLREPQNRGSLRLSQTGMWDNETLTVSKVNPNENGTGGVLETKQCQVSLSSAIRPESVSENSAIQALYGCDVIGGNSGSALRNAQNEIVGLVFAGNRNNDLANLYAALLQSSPVLPQRFGLATNLTCVDVSSVQVDLSHSKCVQVSKAQDVKANEDAMLRAASKDILNQIARDPRLQSADTRFGYRFIGTPDHTQIQYAPSCFSSPNFWLGQIEKNWLGQLPNSLTASVPVLTWTIKMSIGDDLKVHGTATSDDNIINFETITFSPRALSKTHASPVSTLSADGSLSSMLGLSQKSSWSDCPAGYDGLKDLSNY